MAEENRLAAYVADTKMLERLSSTFKYHPPKEDQGDRYDAIRRKAGEFGLFLVQMTPPSREQSLALTALEECVMRANQAIAINE